MDSCFNKYIPKSTDDMIIIRPAGKTFINGMSEVYSFDEYDPQALKGILTKQDFESMIGKLNNAIFNEYPCPGC